MYRVIYDSAKDDESKFIKDIDSLANNMFICVYKDGKLCSFRNSFAKIYTAMRLNFEHIVAVEKDGDVIINNFILRRTTQLGTDILWSWYKGKVHERYAFGALGIDSPLVKPLLDKED